MVEKNQDLMEKIVSLCKRRGLIFPGSEIYGGLAGTWDYGPYGVALKNNVKNLWWKIFVTDREDMYGMDAAIIMNPQAWVASGHVSGFSDPLVECKDCKHRFRADQIENKEKCPDCGGKLGEERKFNMMFKSTAGALDSESALREIWLAEIQREENKKNTKKDKKTIEEETITYNRAIEKTQIEYNKSVVYLRPETAGGMFVNFKNILDSLHPKLPFGMGQIGKAFRNEIAPRDFVFRSREFEQMEVEYFVKPSEWGKAFEEWRKVMLYWCETVGLEKSHVYELEVPDGERAHYSKRTIDFEFDFPFGKKELYGLAYRTDFDLKSHTTLSNADLSYFDEETKERFTPHVIEPSLGVDRTVLAVLTEAYREEKLEEDTRIYLAFKPVLAPIKCAVFPLLKNKPELVAKAREVFQMLRKEFSCEFDDNGNIGKRYRRQDEIGTPYCVTVDFDTLEKDAGVTVRDRDTGKQERMPISELVAFIKNKI